MNDAVRRVLASDPTIDITTTGRRSGQPRRIEIWMMVVDERFFITLVLTAVVTSLFAGGWFRYVLNKGWPLLRVRGETEAPPDDDDTPLAPATPLVDPMKEPAR